MSSHAIYPKPSGWQVRVWFTTPKLHEVMVLNPEGKMIPFAGPGEYVLGGLTASKAGELLSCVGKLNATGSDSDAVIHLRACVGG
jgi:hypothetical protein